MPYFGAPVGVHWPDNVLHRDINLYLSPSQGDSQMDVEPQSFTAQHPFDQLADAIPQSPVQPHSQSFEQPTSDEEEEPEKELVQEQMVQSLFQEQEQEMVQMSDGAPRKVAQLADAIPQSSVHSQLQSFEQLTTDEGEEPEKELVQEEMVHPLLQEQEQEMVQMSDGAPPKVAVDLMNGVQIIHGALTKVTCKSMLDSIRQLAKERPDEIVAIRYLAMVAPTPSCSLDT